MKSFFLSLFSALLATLGVVLITLNIVAMPLYAQSITVEASNLGQSSCGSQLCKNITLRNTGAAPVIIANLVLNSSLFSLQTPLPTLPFTLSNGSTKEIGVCYAPQLPFRRDSALLNLSLSGGATLQYTLFGESLAPIMSFQQQHYRFGTVQVGRTDSLHIKVYNPGNDTLRIPAVQGLALPFSLSPFRPSIVPPRDSAVATLFFSPTAEGGALDTAVFSYSLCNQPTKFRVSGVAATAPTGSLGGVLQCVPTPIDFDTTLCGTTKCFELSIKNIGNGVARILDIVGGLAQPFRLIPPPKATLSPDSSVSFTLCYSPEQVDSVDNATLRLRVDTRQSINVALLFDESDSMKEPIGFNDQTRKVVAAREAGSSFIDELLFDEPHNVADTAGVFAFSDKGLDGTFRILQNFSVDKLRLKNSFASLSPRSSTCLYYSIIEAIKLLRVRTNPTLIVLSDGQDSCSLVKLPLQAVIDTARSAGVRVFIIAVLDIAETKLEQYKKLMQQLGDSTGGRAFFTYSSSEIRQAYSAIAAEMSKNASLYIPIRGRGTVPQVQISPLPLDFDSVRIHQTRCLPATIHNTGATPLFINPAQLAINAEDFSIDTTSLHGIFVRPFDSTSFSLCFRPTKLRLQKAEGLQRFSSCAAAAQFRVQGAGYDSLTIALNTRLVAKPGDKLELPLQLLDSLWADYGVDSLFFTVDYHSSLLDTLAPYVKTEGTSSASMKAITSVATSFQGDTMSVHYALRGTTLRQATAQGELLRLSYAMLNPGVMGSDLRLRNVRFADGNPRVGVVQPARVNLDSSCFAASRLLDTRKRRGVNITNLLLSADNTAQLFFQTEENTKLRLSVYTLLGNSIHTIFYPEVSKGEHQISFTLPHLPTSAYLIELSSPTERDSRLVLMGE